MTIYFIDRAFKKGQHSILQTVFIFALFFPSTLYGDPWVSTGDEKARFHIQRLSDAGKLKCPTNTWPIMWADLQLSLEEIDVKSLNDIELWSYQYLRHTLEMSKNTFSGAKQLQISNSRPAVVDFATDSREKSEASGYISTTTERFAFRIQGNYIQDPIDEKQSRFDGSYAAATWGNWVFGAGAINRWWGPGWQSSLIMSNNARPAPGVFVQRKSSLPFEWPILSLIGPWNLHLFANQLEKERFIPNAKLLGGRVNFKPLSFLEVGISRAAQWGGNGRPESLSSLKNMIIGNDNRRKDGIKAGGSNELGNQVLSYDWRLKLPFIKKFSVSIFHQQLSEDKSEEGLPFQNAETWGIETSFLWRSINTHITYETYDSRNDTNGIYEHGIYRTGYRTWGRNIGSSLDTSSLGKTILAEHYFTNGHQISWRLGKLDFNIDNVKSQTPAGHPYGSNHIEETYFEFNYKLPLSKTLLFSSGVTVISDPIEYQNETIESSLNLGIEFRW